eukprot:TRINITY_DN1006_c1_g1_i1.p1 TRINITY_DN1006_c1_g1~~TRINITY_DN1006_c1_g1_i1.p1  ORF type:complete len:394 (-),score=42.07 TRINITY_DN1006_c1_g1_i1:344-1525(-)
MSPSLSVICKTRQRHHLGSALDVAVNQEHLRRALLRSVNIPSATISMFCKEASSALPLPFIPHPVFHHRSSQTRTQSFAGWCCSTSVPETSKHEILSNNMSIDSSTVQSVNYFISRACNYSCKFCFHTQKNTSVLSLAKARLGLQMLRRAGTEKINFAGGEPFLQHEMLGELCKTSHELGMAVSIISNGSLITQKWMQEYGAFVDILGVSVDSFNPKTNAAIGRGGDANNRHVERILRVRDQCAKHDIMFKMNTVVCSLNWEEDMNAHVLKLDPMRWKVFQVLILKDENSGLPGELRDARPLVVSDRQYQSFIFRHSDMKQLVTEPNNVMQNSYLLLDEELRFLDCSGGGKVPSPSILDVGVYGAIAHSGFDQKTFVERGGVYKWKRERDNQY